MLSVLHPSCEQISTYFVSNILSYHKLPGYNKMEFRPDYDFEKMRNDAMNQAKEEKLLQIRVRQRRLILEYRKQISSDFRKIEEEAHEELQANLEKIRNDYAELIETDRNLDSAQLIPLVSEQARVLTPGEDEPKITDLESGPPSPILGREPTLRSSEVKDSTSTSTYIFQSIWCASSLYIP